MNSERGSQSSMDRLPIVSVAVFLLGVLLGLMLPNTPMWRWAMGTSARPIVSADPFVLSNWEYPGAKNISSQTGGNTETTNAGVPVAINYLPDLYTYSTQDALEKVWGHYANLLELENQEFKPGSTLSRSEFHMPSAGGVNSSKPYLVNTGDVGRQLVQSGVMVTKRQDYTITIFLSRGKEEQKTTINIVVEKKSNLPGK